MAKVYDNATDLITFARLQSQNTTSGSSYLGSDGLLKFAAEDEPRIEYGSDGSLKGLLIEEQRTNLVTYSEDFSDASWANDTSNMSVTPDYANSPSGTQSASRLEYSGGTSNAYFQVGPSPSSGTANAILTFSIWVSGSGLFRLKNTHASVIDNYSSVISATAALTRYDFTVSNGSSAGNGTQIVGIVPADDLSAFDLTVWGAQLEEGSFATSYIPTSGSQQTRSADVASIPVSAFGYNQTAGTVVVEFGAYDVGAVTASIVSFTDDPVSNDWVLVYASTSNTVMDVTDTGVRQALFTVSGDRRTTGGIAGIAVKENAFAFTIDGSAPQTDSSGTMPADVSVVRIGSWASNPAYLNGHIKSIQYYPRRLTDAQLQELTA